MKHIQTLQILYLPSKYVAPPFHSYQQQWLWLLATAAFGQLYGDSKRFHEKCTQSRMNGFVFFVIFFCSLKCLQFVEIMTWIQRYFVLLHEIVISVCDCFNVTCALAVILLTGHSNTNSENILSGIFFHSSSAGTTMPCLNLYNWNFGKNGQF